MNSQSVVVMPDLCDRRHRFHVLIALLMLRKAGIDLSQIYIKAIGQDENYKGEVHSQVPGPGENVTGETEILLEVGFPSAVDYLPYQFFYGLDTAGKRTSGWEDKARCLMAPFDGSTIRWCSRAVFEQLKYIGSTIDLSHTRRILNLFEFEHANSSSADETLLWASVLPQFHLWSGNPYYMPKVLSALFGVDFAIRENSASKHAVRPEIQSRLGSSYSVIGRDFVIGREFTEHNSTYELIIRLADAREVHDWLPEGTHRRKLERVLGTCMPEHLACNIRIELMQQPACIGRESAQAHLGVSWFLYNQDRSN